MLPASCATLTVSKSILQTSTMSRDNLLYILRPLAPTSSTKCLPPPPSTHPTNCLARSCSSYPHIIMIHQPRSRSPPAQSRPPSSHNLISTPPYSEASPMAFCKPSPIERPAPAYPTSNMKTDSTTLNSESSTTRTPSMSPQLAICSTTAKSPTSTSQWVMGFIKRPSGFASMTTGWCQAITAPRGPMSSPTSSIFTPRPTIVSTPPLRRSQPGSGICSPAPEGTFRFYNKRWANTDDWGLA
jgi:hypothetical protein